VADKVLRRVRGYGGRDAGAEHGHLAHGACSRHMARGHRTHGQREQSSAQITTNNINKL
jgi:hypothetical protein